MKRNRLILAYQVIGGIPDDQLKLSDIVANKGKTDNGLDASTVSPHNCGTIACGFGWLAMHPQFNKWGMALTADGSPTRPGQTHGWIDYDRIGSKVFGISYGDSCDLFKPRTEYEAEDFRGLTDKELWLKRCKSLLDTGSADITT